MIDWRNGVREQDGPLYLGIADALARAIASGALGSGTRLPPQRELATSLGVDLTTVSRAMVEARRRGLVVTRGRLGTFVARSPALSPRADSIDLSVNYPPPMGAGLAAAFRETATAVVRQAGDETLLDYPRHAWSGRFAEAGAFWCSTLGVGVGPERVALAGGAQQGMIGVFAATCEPGDVLVTGGLTYPGILAIAQRLGVRAVGVDQDGEGLIPASLEQACRRVRPKLAYIVPTFENPTTSSSGERRRSELADVLESAGVALIEDDGHAALLEGAPPPISSLIPHRSWYVTSLSKSVSPGLRTAYVVAPSAVEAERLSRALIGLGQFPAPVAAEIATRWVLDGTAKRASAAMREAAAGRWAIARRMLPELRAGIATTNHFGWLPLPPRWTGSSFAERARTIGVQVSAASAFAVARRFNIPGVRVCLGAVSSTDRLASGLEILGGLLHEDPALSRPLY